MLEGRTLAPQLGWLQGYSTAHAGLQLEAALQQSAALGVPVWVLHVYLSTFFPSLDKSVQRINEGKVWMTLMKSLTNISVIFLLVQTP